MMARARAFRVIKGGVRGDRPFGKTIFESRDEKVLADLRRSLQIVGTYDGPICFCRIRRYIEFLDESANCLAAIAMLSPTHIRWNAWGLDALVTDALERWLAAHGIPYPAVPEATDSEKEHAKEFARDFLDSRLPVLEALRGLRSLAYTDAIAYEKDRALILAFESELPYEPIGYVRQQWAPYALKMKDEELALVEARWTKGFLEACKRIANRQ